MCNCTTWYPRKDLTSMISNHLNTLGQERNWDQLEVHAFVTILIFWSFIHSVWQLLQKSWNYHRDQNMKCFEHNVLLPYRSLPHTCGRINVYLVFITWTVLLNVSVKCWHLIAFSWQVQSAYSAYVTLHMILTSSGGRVASGFMTAARGTWDCLAISEVQGIL